MILFWTGIFLASLYVLILLFSGGLWFYVRLRKKHRITASGKRLLILAPHQDDGVAMAGGYAQQVLRNGGEVRVLYITNGPGDDKTTRRNEALDAWGLAGLLRESLVFLGHDTLTGLTGRKEIEDCTEEMKRFMMQYRPDTVIVPLYEGGNYQHDVTNYILSGTLGILSPEVTVLEAPEYNFYMSLKTTPEKVLSGLCRLIPFVHYAYPPEPVLDDPVCVLEMTEQQLDLKRSMLARFASQNPDKLVERFGFPDRFQKYHDHDYTKPPFDYERSLARKMHGCKKKPVIGRLAAGMMKWTSTIHPDPDYGITRIPL